MSLIRPKLIIVTGLAATGKTTIARMLSEDLAIPFFSKDRINVELLSNLGVQDRSWDIKIGITAVKLQLQIANELLRAGQSVLLESNYKKNYDAPLLLGLIQKTSCVCLQIVCGTEGSILVDRYIKRTFSGERPKELNEENNIKEFLPKLIKGFDDPLELPGQIIKIDTTDFSKVRIADLRNIVEDFLKA